MREYLLCYVVLISESSFFDFSGNQLPLFSMHEWYVLFSKDLMSLDVTQGLLRVKVEQQKIEVKIQTKL